MTRASFPRLINSVQPVAARQGGRAAYALTILRHASASATTTTAAAHRDFKNGVSVDNIGRETKATARLFERLPTTSLIRSIILGQVLKTPALFKTGLYLLEKIANSKSVFLNADKNPLIRAVVRSLIYNHFCAGTNRAEVQKTIGGIKDMGFSGVILCYSKEVMAAADPKGNHVVEAASDEETTGRDVQEWCDGILATLDMVGEGDYIGFK